MTKPKYATAAERQAALSAKAKAQMLAQWERQREESGTTVGYYGCHRRVRAQRGRARDQMCACGAQARHWAHIHDTDPADVQNYEAMCQKCHWAYDQIGAKSAATAGHEGRRQLALKAWETKNRKPGEGRGIALRAWETKRRNALANSALVVDRSPHGDSE